MNIKGTSVRQNWTFGVMCYNEEGNITQVLENILAIAPDLSLSFEILVVDDGSKDQSVPLIKAFQKNHPNVDIRLIEHGVNLGIGFTLRDIYLNGKHELIANIPADGQFDVSEYHQIGHLNKNEFVAFYRKENLVYNSQRNLFSYLNKMLNLHLLGIYCKDVNWTKVYQRDALKGLNLRITSSLIESEICSKLIYLGHQALEYPSQYKSRTSGVSKGASFFILKQAIFDIVKLIWVCRRFSQPSQTR
jgi:glycosyltransferase involved in cell wall biosynthesis